jgi:hypothetical protein
MSADGRVLAAALAQPHYSEQQGSMTFGHIYKVVAQSVGQQPFSYSLAHSLTVRPDKSAALHAAAKRTMPAVGMSADGSTVVVCFSSAAAAGAHHTRRGSGGSGGGAFIFSWPSSPAQAPVVTALPVPPGALARSDALARGSQHGRACRPL